MDVGEGSPYEEKAQTGGGKLNDQRNLFCSASGHQMRANEEGREAFFLLLLASCLVVIDCSS